MVRTFVSAAVLGLFISASPVASQEMKMDHSDHSGHGQMEVKPGTEASGSGVVNSVDADKGMINLTHEPMPDLGWPTMTMDLPVTKHVVLGGIKAGDKVDFKIKLGRDKKYRVIEMLPAK